MTTHRDPVIALIDAALEASKNDDPATALTHLLAALQLAESQGRTETAADIRRFLA